MHAFADAAGRTWLVGITIGAQVRVKALTDCDLYALFDGEGEALSALLSDPPALCTVVYHLARDDKGRPPESEESFADALAKLPEGAQRTAAAMEVMGRSGTSLLPMLKDGAAGLDEWKRKAEEMGLTMSTEDAEAARSFTATIRTLELSLKMLAFRVGSALAPTLLAIRNWIQPIVTKAIAWVQANQGLVVSMSKAGLIIAGVGAGMMLLGFALSAIFPILGALSTAFGVMWAIASGPVGIIGTAIVALGGYLLYTSGAGGKALGWLGEQFGQLKEDATEAWGGIMAAVQKGDLAGAFQIAWVLIKLEWASGINWLSEQWGAFKDFMTDTFYKAVYLIGTTMDGAWAGIKSAWRTTMTFFADTFDQVVAGIKIGWNHVATSAAIAWAKAKGLFGSSKERDEKVAKLTEEEKRRDREIVTETEGGIGARHKEDAAAGKADDDEAFKRERAFKKLMDDQADARKALREAEAGGNREEETRLRRELAGLVAAAKTAGSKDTTLAPGKKPAGPGMWSGKGDAAGTFEAAVAGRLGTGGSVAERTASATERTAAAVEDLAGREDWP